MNIRYSIITALLTLIPLWVSAQELTVQSFSLSPTEIIPSNDQQYDLNGTACALVKVQVVDDIDRVEGNVIGGIIKRGTEKWIFLTDGTKEFRLFPKSHLPLNIVCSNFNISSLESKRVYVLRLSGGQQSVSTTKESESSKMTAKESKTTVSPPSSVTPSTPKKSGSISFGIRTGGNLAWTQFGDGYDKVSMTTSFHLGISMDILLSESFYLNTALLYSGKGYKYEKVENATGQYIDLPVQASIRFGDVSSAQFQFNAGPYLAIGIGGKIKSETTDKEQNFFDYYNSFDYGLAIGCGVIFSKHYYLGVNAQIGFADYRNRNVGISIGYNF